MPRIRLHWIPWFVHALDPRRSLGTKVGWFVAALSVAFALVAGVWLGNMSREGLREQHGRQLTLDAGQLANTLDHALRARLHSVQTIAAIIGSDSKFHSPRVVRLVLDELQATYPELEWIGFVDPQGAGIAATQGRPDATDSTDRSWFLAASAAPWIGEINARVPLAADPAGAGVGERVIVIAAPVRDSAGRFLGVVTAHLGWRWLAEYAKQLPVTLRQQTPPQTIILGRDGIALAGPPEFAGKRWQASQIHGISAFEATASLQDTAQRPQEPRIEQLFDGRQFLVSGSYAREGGSLQALGWTFLLIEPALHADRREQVLWNQIIRACLALGGVAALFGVVVSRRLTNRVAQLSQSVDAAGATGNMRIAVPAGTDEISRLGRAFANLLGALQKERAELGALSADLERRVAARTREVEQLARESRYSAVVRERLKIARDLHDTLAHSMMAMLAEVRLLRKMYARDPSGIAEELARAEKVAHEGLIEARASITRMRLNPVRDIGLGAALADALGKLAERTGLHVEMDFDPRAAGFAEETAEGVFRIAEEALRNIERHARASHVKAALRCTGERSLTLELSDDGAGFDAAATPAGHFGLIGMHEQAQLIGAQLAIESAPDAGTVLRLAFGSGRDG